MNLIEYKFKSDCHVLPAESWKYRYAGLMAVSACGEGCHSHMEQMLGSIVEAVLPYGNDPVS